MGPNVDTGLISRLMAATELRAKVIASNIANQNTPGYTRQEVRFEDVLRRALAAGRRDLDGITPRIVADRSNPAGPDGNNVSLEQEMSSLRENQLRYETYATMLQSQFDLMRLAITGGN